MKYDAVIVGAGHNGLAAAVHLAQKGWRVAVVEEKCRAGRGGEDARTHAARVPARFRRDESVDVRGLAVLSDAQGHLAASNGLAFAPVEDCFASVFPDGTFLGVSKTLETTVARIAAVSPRDADGLEGDARALRRRRAAYFRAARRRDAVMGRRGGDLEGVSGAAAPAGCMRR